MGTADNGAAVWADHCWTAPDYDYTITPDPNWQTTGTVSIGASGCRLYRMYLYDDKGYEFSICSEDGVGGSCSGGDGDLSMYDATGEFLWYIDGVWSCDWDASTLGRWQRGWIPSEEDYYYLKVSEYDDTSMIYNLAYRSGELPSGDIRIEPTALQFDCTGGGAMATGQSTTQAITSLSIEQDTNDKIVVDEEIMTAFAAGDETVRVVVRLAEPLEVLAQTNWKSKRSLKRLQKAIAKRQDESLAGLEGRHFRLRYRFENMAALSAEVTREGLERLKRNPRVRTIEPVFELQPSTSQGIDIMDGMPYRSEYNGQGVAIAICDTGIDCNHPMLGGGGFPNDKVIGGYDFGDDDNDPGPYDESHGTACAGIAVGDVPETSFDYIGGVACGAKLYSLKITQDPNNVAYSDDMARAWDWCVSHKYDDPNHPILVVSTSFGGGRFYSSCDDYIGYMTKVANNNVAAGITMLAASGNDGYTDSMLNPACISSIISVGAVYDYIVPDRVTGYSNSATFLDLLAPSHNAYTPSIVGAGDDGGDYFYTFGGTSAASPYAAGAVASLQSAAEALLGRFLTVSEVKSILVSTGDDVEDYRSALVKPRVNLAAAIDSLAACSGEAFLIYNDGEGPLLIDHISTPNWVSLEPNIPFTIEAGWARLVCVEPNCLSCDGINLAGELEVFSDDPNENPCQEKVYVYNRCCEWAGNLDTDCDVDTVDLALLLDYWLAATCEPFEWCQGADLNRDGKVDLEDVAILATNWLKGT